MYEVHDLVSWTPDELERRSLFYRSNNMLEIESIADVDGHPVFFLIGANIYGEPMRFTATQDQFQPYAGGDCC